MPTPDDPTRLNDLRGEVSTSPAAVDALAYPRIEMVAGTKEGLVVHLAKGEHILGRSRQHAQIHLEDTSASRRHAVLMVEGGQVTLRDLKSRNGTLINGVRLGENEEKELKHLDQIRLGIYLFRVVMHPVTPEELRQAKVLQQPAPKTPPEPLQAAPPLPPTELRSEPESPAETQALSTRPAETLKEELVEEGVEKSLPLQVDANDPLNAPLRTIFFGLSLLSILVGLMFFFYYRQPKEVVPSPVPVSLPSTLLSQPEPSPSDMKEPDVEPPPTPAAMRTFPAFLEIRSSPESARISFLQRSIGETPLKSPVELEPGKEYEVVAEFEMREIGDRYQQKKVFTADPRQEVVRLSFDADIGVIKVLNIPRGVDFNLEGYYAYDKYRANPVKLANIVFGKPITVPFGQYMVELKEKVRVGDSETFVKEIRYHREYTINAEHRTWELTIGERDLQFFSARISSEPSQSDVFLDGQKVGRTPFEGDLPLGKHELKLVHEGYFDYVQPLEMRENTPLELKLTLKTSKVGEIINLAQTFRRAGHHNEAIDALVDSLKDEASDREKVEVHYLLGDSYLMIGNLQQAALYFEQAKANPDFHYKALLGLARVQHALENRNGAIALLVEIFLNVKSGNVLLNDASSLFQKISPLKSVLYVTTNPVGASVVINGREVEQKTPLILSDLAFGNYRIEVSKPGFRSQQVRKDVKIAEFSPVIIKLEVER